MSKIFEIKNFIIVEGIILFLFFASFLIEIVPFFGWCGYGLSTPCYDYLGFIGLYVFSFLFIAYLFSLIVYKLIHNSKIALILGLVLLIFGIYCVYGGLWRLH